MTVDEDSAVRSETTISISSGSRLSAHARAEHGDDIDASSHRGRRIVAFPSNAGLRHDRRSEGPLAAFESDGNRLLPHRVHGGQLLGHFLEATHDLDFIVKLPQAAGIVQEFGRDLHRGSSGVGSLSTAHQFNAIDTRSALNVDFWLARAEVNVRISSGALRWLRKLPIEIPCLLHCSILTAKLFSTRRRDLLEKRMAHFLLHRTGAINGYISLWLIGSITRLLRRVTNPSMIRAFRIFKAASFQESWTSFRISRNSEWERSG
jgi:hypothetical protein